MNFLSNFDITKVVIPENIEKIEGTGKDVQVTLDEFENNVSKYSEVDYVEKQILESDLKEFNSIRLGLEGGDLIIDLPENLPEARHELIRSYYSMRDFVPKRIAVDGEVSDGEVLCEWLSSLAKRKVNIVTPQRGEQHSLMEMCRSNAAQKLALYLGKSGKSTAALDELGTLLGLKSPPKFIESYDISHTAGSENVAGMVVFKDGVPYKKAYKHFKIKGFSGQDDCRSMAEVIARRFGEYLKSDDNNAEEGFGKLPVCNCREYSRLLSTSHSAALN